MHYLQTIYMKTQKEYEEALEKHGELWEKTQKKTKGKREEQIHSEFHEAAKPVLKTIRNKRLKLGSLRKCQFLKNEEVLGAKLPIGMILKVAEFVPDKITLK